VLPASNATLLSRLRAGSMPQRNSILGGNNPFGNSVFMSNWTPIRDRADTLQSIRSSEGPSSPRDGPVEGDVRTLDYLGLVDTPQSARPAGLSRSDLEALVSQQRATSGMTIADLASHNAFINKNTANRFRSYSVNAKEKYADVDDDDSDPYDGQQIYTDEAAAQAAAIHEAVRQHNLDVQAFANFASANRPRARTAGVLDSPLSRGIRNQQLPGPSRLESSITAADLQNEIESDYTGLAHAVHTMKLAPKGPFEAALDPNNLETPTRALWLGSIPPSTTVSSLNVIFGPFGPIEFARVLTHKSCGFVNFENVQSAIAAKNQYNGKEIFPGSGPIRVGFAKEQSASNTPGANGAFPSPSPDPFATKTRSDDSALRTSALPVDVNAQTAAAALVTPRLADLQEEVFSIVQQFGAAADDHPSIAEKLNAAVSFNDFVAEIPVVAEPGHTRVHDAPRLREIRKRIDNNSCSPAEIEGIAIEMIPEIAELSSDYLGNTVVQKLFEHCTEETKEAMLTEIAPHLAEIGVHKNGTWAAQKIIDVARTEKQMRLIADALRPHSVNLFLDQYGNYVMQCCLRFESPMNGFIFDTMLSRLWDVAQGRFGARAMRACLESHHATNDQRRLMAAAIALHSVQLATNSNGALLLTWFLDTCTFPRRRSVLAPRLIAHLVHLCTHKVAYLTVLKVINQRGEPEARDAILRALFFDEKTLTDIVNDHSCGATLIFKVLTTPFLDENIRSECVENVRNVLLRIKAQPSQGYKRLMDEVGLSTRHGATPVSHEGRSNNVAVPANGAVAHMDATPSAYNSQGYAAAGPQHPSINQGVNSHAQRSTSMDSSFDPYINGYTHSPSMSHNGMTPTSAVQYPLQQAQPQISRNAGFYPNQNGMQMHSGLPYANNPPVQHMMDPYRQNMAGAPIAPPGIVGQTGYQQPAYGNAMMGMNNTLNNGYGQYQNQMPQYYQQPPMQSIGQQRRGRVSSHHTVTKSS
jgi:protein JSN1